MPVNKDLATLVGHLEPFSHLAEAIIFDTDSTGAPVSVKEVILSMIDGGVVVPGIPSNPSIVPGSVVYLDSFGVLQPALADDIATARVVGIVVEDTDSAGSSSGIKQVGPLSAYVGLVPGTRYFLSDTVPGGITDTPPDGTGHVVHSVGIAVDPTTLYINTNIQPTIRS